MRVIIDMQGLQTPFSAHRGVGRYIHQLVDKLLLTAGENEIFLAFNGNFVDSIDRLRLAYKDRLSADRLVVWNAPLSTDNLHKRADWAVSSSEIIREVFLNSFQPDIIFCPNLQEGMHDCAVTSVHRVSSPAIYCSTLHDLIPLYYEEQYLGNPVARSWYDEKLDHAKNSELILTVSDHSRSDIIKLLKVDGEKVKAVLNAYDAATFNDTPATEGEKAAVRRRCGIERDYILYLGGSDQHKNVERLVAAYARLPKALRERYQLVLGGRDLAKNAAALKLQELKLQDSVVLPGFIAESDLPALLKAASCFVLPSTHEGFGLPLLEAMACGTPSVGSSTTSIQEIASSPEALFDPYQVDSIARKIEEVLTDPAFAKRLSESGLEKAREFDWEKSAREVWGHWQDALDSKERSNHFYGDPIDEAVQAIAADQRGLADYARGEIARAMADSFVYPGNRPRIFLDISTIVDMDHRSGIQRVTRAISGEFLKFAGGEIDAEVHLVYSVSGNRTLYMANDYMRRTWGTLGAPSDMPVILRPGDTIIFLDLHPGVAITQAAETRKRRARGIKVYHVVYDILPILRPQGFWPELCSEFASWIRSVSLSDGALCISRAVADELSDHLSAYGPKRPTPFNIGYFHLGADIENSAPTSGMPPNAHEVIDNLRQRPTFLMVGTIEPRKGYAQVLDAFEQLWARGIDANLVFVGRMGWGMEPFGIKARDHAELGQRLFWLQGISDEYLDHVYQNASCLIAASDAEGFGLPLIEAAQRKLPIIAREIPVFREVAGDHAFYFPNERDAAVIADTVAEWLDLYRQERHPTSTDMPWLTWNASARQLLSVIRDDNWYRQIEFIGAIEAGKRYDAGSEEIEWRNFHVLESDDHGDFRWTTMPEAVIGFSWAQSDTDRELVMECKTLGEQSIKVKLRDDIIFDQKIDLAMGKFRVRLPHLAEGYNEIRLILDDARVPGPHDSRQLALAAYSIQIL